jgi:hypothetical protein
MAVLLSEPTARRAGPLWERFPRDAPGQASRDEGGWDRDSLLCKGVTPRRDRGIDSGERGRAFGRGSSGKPGGPFCGRRMVEAPMRFAPKTSPVSGAAVSYTARSRASSGLETGGVLWSDADGYCKTDPVGLSCYSCGLIKAARASFISGGSGVHPHQRRKRLRP